MERSPATRRLVSVARHSCGSFSRVLLAHRLRRYGERRRGGPESASQSPEGDHPRSRHHDNPLRQRDDGGSASHSAGVACRKPHTSRGCATTIRLRVDARHQRCQHARRYQRRPGADDHGVPHRLRHGAQRDGAGLFWSGRDEHAGTGDGSRHRASARLCPMAPPARVGATHERYHSRHLLGGEPVAHQDQKAQTTPPEADVPSWPIWVPAAGFVLSLAFVGVQLWASLSSVVAGP